MTNSSIRILLIEDDTDLFALLKYNLEKEGFSLTGLQTGKGALELCRQVRPDLILLDIMLPDSDGLDICKGIRKDPELASTPVIFLTARAEVEDRVRGLDAGADDYLTKPFALPELEARVRALTRRGTGKPTRIDFGALSYDQADRMVKLDGRILELSARELGLLEILLLRAGRLVNKEQLVDHLCSWGDEVSTNAIEVYVHRLRKKLDAGGIRIATVRGLGYCLEEPPAGAGDHGGD